MPTPLQRIPEPALHLFGPQPRSTSARTRTGTPHGSPVIYIIRKNRQNVLSEAGKIFRLPGTRHEPADRACTEQLLRLLSVI